MPSNDLSLDRQEDDDAPAIVIGGRRAEAVHRLQVGAFGLGAIVLMVALANIVMERAKETEATIVPEAASTVAVQPIPTPNKDPLVDAGVVPEMPAHGAQTDKPEGNNGASAAQP